jgi:hypothetical protein
MVANSQEFDAKHINGYNFFEELIICNNLFRNGKVILMVGNFIPLLIEKNKYPLVSLSIPIDKDKWKVIVRKNKSLNSNILVNLLKNSKLCVEINKENVDFKKIGKYTLNLRKTILSVEKTADSSAIINEIDMRPLGFNIYCDHDGLHVGGIVLSNNSFIDVHTMIKL